MLPGMAKRNGAMHVAKVSKKYVTKDGVSRESVAYLPVSYTHLTLPTNREV